MASFTPFPKRAAFAKVNALVEQWRSGDTQVKNLFDENPARFEQYTVELERKGNEGSIFADYSKNYLNSDIFKALLELAEESKLKENIEKMFNGEAINFTEGRSVLHTALRRWAGVGGEDIKVDGKGIKDGVLGVLKHMIEFTKRVKSGEWVGYTGKKVESVVNIGIGGSDLGPAMVVQALAPYCDPAIHSYFVSNVDGSHIHDTLKKCNAETTLFLVASKTFTTQETISNAQSAKAWLVEQLGVSAVKNHFVALSTNAEKVKEFGIDEENMFGFWDWVGGRYSVWSAIGLSVMLAIGADNFIEFLTGAKDMDTHFRTADFSQNIPVISAMIGILYSNFFKFPTQAILPYDQHMLRFAAYLQQADMESNGKYVTVNGDRVSYSTGSIVWGEPGTNGQHAFYQLIHQGTHVIPCDFIAASRPHDQVRTTVKKEGEEDQVIHHHRMLVSNFLAQTEALMNGRNAADAKDELEKEVAAGKRKAETVDMVTPHKVFEGNRPSTSILVQTLDPWTLGALVAMYEHKIYAQGVVWGINSFDQWGVELGKKLCTTILSEVNSGSPSPKHDASTRGLMAHYLKHRGEKG